MALSELNGRTWTVEQLFTGRKYRLEYYQREYAWSEQNVRELLDDLTGRFLNEYDESHLPKEVGEYRGYFLGPIVTNHSGGSSSLVDGQQRLTTLMLLLIGLHHLSNDKPGAQNLTPLIFSAQFGEETFNIDVPERNEVMQAIFKVKTFDPTDKSTSIRQIYERYNDIVNILPDELEDKKLIYFIYWLLSRVFLVEISTSDQDMALEVFETMNDRGMQLSNTDMLKSFLLSKIDEQEIEDANKLWRGRINSLTDLYNNADSAFIKVWLRSKYADSFRTRKGDDDFALIGKAFHKWVRDNKEKMGLQDAKDYHRFVNTDFKKMSSRYMQLVQATRNYDADLESVFSNAAIGITLQYLPILATVTPDDDEQTFRLKARLVAGYIDILVVRRIVNYRSHYYRQILPTMFNLAKDIRDLNPEKLRDKLLKRVRSLEPSFPATMNFYFGLNQRNGIPIRCLLARMTAWIEQECGDENRFSEYVDRSRKDPYEIEHIWPNRFDRYKGEFHHKYDFDIHRNLLGGLLLLPKSCNASLGDKPYEDKLKCYVKQNLLAKSLHRSAYEDDSGVDGHIKRTDLPFKPYPDGFSKEDLDERQELYRQICERIWDPKRLLAIELDAEGSSSSTPASSSGTL